MNPFSNSTSYDDELSRIVTRLDRPSDAAAALGELLEYLPQADVRSDLAVIKAALCKYFASENPRVRALANQALCAILEQCGPKLLKSIQCGWMAYNFDSSDEHARRILAEYFRMPDVEEQFYGYIKRLEPLRGLACYAYLISISAGEYAFEFAGLDTHSVYVLEQFARILTVMLRRKPGMKELIYGPDLARAAERLTVADESPFAAMHRRIFDEVAGLSDFSLVPQKYKILLAFYNYADASVYEESRYFIRGNYEGLFAAAAGVGCPYRRSDNLLLGEGLEYELLHVSSVPDMKMVAGRVRDKEDFVLANLSRAMNVFEVCAECGLPPSFIVKNSERLDAAIKESVRGLCRRRGSGQDIERLLSDEYLPILAGKWKIMYASLLGTELDPAGFSKEDIEEVFESSVRVFPLEYFASRSFGCSAKPLLELHPASAEKLLPLFPNTKLVDVLLHISDIESLKALVLPMSEQAALKEYAKAREHIEAAGASVTAENADAFQAQADRVWSTFHYKLRELAAPLRFDNELLSSPEVSVQLVFEHFFNRNYLAYVAKQAGKRREICEESVKYMRTLEVPNTVYLTGYNFDDQERFYGDLELPGEDARIRVLCELFGGIRSTPDETVVLHLLELLCYKKIAIESPDEIKAHISSLMGSGDVAILNPAQLRDWIDLGVNSFILERFLRQLYAKEATLDGRLLSTNKNKALDVLLRHGHVDYRYLYNADATFLSPAALELAVSAILLKKERPDSPYKEFLDAHFVMNESVDPLLFLRSDRLLVHDCLRGERIQIYEPLVSELALAVSGHFINSYSFAKLDKNSDDHTVFELMVSELAEARDAFWLLLVRALHYTSNIYISLFIEDVILRNMEGSSTRHCGSPRLLQSTMCISEYAQLCSEEELAMLAFVLPAVYRRLNTARPLGPQLESLVKQVALKKIEHSKISYSKTDRMHVLKMTYLFDSVPYTATINVPVNFPSTRPRIEFDYKSAKCPKFYIKINELLRRTTKFAEVFTQWKVNLDNRFSGHKECLICYYILEPRMRTFAEYECHNCKNKFHKRCIFEWVKTGKSTKCPLCRVELGVWD